LAEADAVHAAFRLPNGIVQRQTEDTNYFHSFQRASPGVYWKGMRLIWLSIIIPCAFMAPRLALAGNYYIDSSVATSGNGQSWATAWKGISNINGLSSGDTVYFSGGSSGKSYSVSNWAPAAGTKATPITYAVGQDAGHTGMVTFTGSGMFLVNNLTGVTINGQVAGNIRMTVDKSYGWTIYSDGGNTNGFKFLYVNFTAPIWGRGTGYEIAYCRGVAPLSMMDDSYIAHIGENDSNHTNNLIHHNYFQVWRIRTSGYGQDILKWVGGASIYNNTFIAAYNASYPGSQHGDGIQTAASHVWIWGNYFEGFISYPILNEMFGNTTDWRIVNNVINTAVADQGSIDWAAYQAMALGASAGNPVVTDYIIANNTIISGPGRNGIHFLKGGTPATAGPGCYIVNNIVYNNGGSLVYYDADPDLIVSNNVGGTSGLSFQNISAYPNGDFHLAVGATAAIDKGISPSYLTGTYTVDMDGKTRTGTWDIGAFEYGGGTSPSPATPPTGLTATVH
jgi:hypothetical protein